MKALHSLSNTEISSSYLCVELNSQCWPLLYFAFLVDNARKGQSLFHVGPFTEIEEVCCKENHLNSLKSVGLKRNTV